jgi:hypothetical protein
MNDLTQELAPATGAAPWPPHRTVAELHGSLPMGGYVPNTPIHAFQTPAPQLQLTDTPTRQAQRRDIPLDDLLAFVIDDVLTADEADAMVAASERFGYLAAAPGIATPPGMRMNKSVHWVADGSLLDPMLARIRHLLPQELDGARLHEHFSQRINMYRYDAQDVFNLHTDGDWPGYGLSADRQHMVEWPDLRSNLTMLLYLNGPEDGVEGGSTYIYDRKRQFKEIIPKKGSALFFRHGFGPHSVLHQGCRVTGNQPKYVARINVLYKTVTGK